MPQCMFCYKKGFTDLDEVYSHQVIITNQGVSICPKLAEWNSVIDSAGSNELFPAKIHGRKYAPKDHNGRFIVFTAAGKLAKEEPTGKHYIHYHLLHGPSPINT